MTGTPTNGFNNVAADAACPSHVGGGGDQRHEDIDDRQVSEMIVSGSENADSEIDVELHQILRSFAERATPETAEKFAHRFLQEFASYVGPSPEEEAHALTDRSAVHFSVGANGHSTHSHSENALEGVLEFWLSPACPGRTVGRITYGHAKVNERLSSAEASKVVRASVASYRDIIDLVSGRKSPFWALARRRLAFSGDREAISSVMPAILRTLRHTASDIQSIHSVASTSGSLNVAVQNETAPWMPNEASETCIICDLPWWPIIRQRHHCRSCGILVCGQCSMRRFPLADGRGFQRRCARCVGVRSAADATAAFTEWSGMSAAGGRSYAPTPQSNCASITRAIGSSDRFLTESSPTAPSGSQENGVLLAQVSASIGPCLKAQIGATPPTDKEKRLWTRLTEAETLASTGSKGGKLMSSLQVVLATGLLRFTFCAIVVLSAAASSTPTLGFPWNNFTDFPRLQLAIFVSSWMCAFVVSPRHLAALCMLHFIRWSCTSLFYDALQPGLAIMHVAKMVPIWSFLCFVVGFVLTFLITRYPRVLAVYTVAFLPIFVYWSCGRVQKILRLSDADAQALLYDNADSIMAPYVTRSFVMLGGLFVKLGQWLSNLSYGIPIQLQQHMKILIDSTKADDEAHVRATVLVEFGKHVEDLFEEFEIEPIASASIAQVHRAIFKSPDGTRRTVAVKLQHAGIEQLITTDLSALERIVSFCVWLGGDKFLETQKMLKLWAKDMLFELDFKIEVENMQQVREGLVAAGIDVCVPKEIDGLVSRRAYAMDFVEGFRFTDVDQLVLHGVDKEAVGRRLLHATASQLLEIGVFNSDPHAGNVLCQTRATTAMPVLLDFGNCIRLPESQRLAYCRLLIALSEVSVTKAREALDALGLVTTQSQTKPERDLEYMLVIFRDTGSRQQQSQGAKEFWKKRKEQREADFEEIGATTTKERKKNKALVARYPTQLPDEFLLFVRMMMLVRGVCTQLDVHLPFIEIFEFHARRALIRLSPIPSRALKFLPDNVALPRNVNAYAALRKRIRNAIAECCAERAGLGIQVCVQVGTKFCADECGGVLGSVDPRPVDQGTPFPLADLSRLLLLLAVREAVKTGKLSYGTPAVEFIDRSGKETQGQSSVQLCHILAHRGLKSAEDGKARSNLAKTCAKDFVEVNRLNLRVAQSLSCAPCVEDDAAYLPLGLGLVASSALKQSLHLGLHTLFKRLPGASDPRISDELALSLAPGSAIASRAASLSSALFSDFRKAMSGQNLGWSGPSSPVTTRTGATNGGGASPRESASPSQAVRPDSSNRESPQSMPTLASVLDEAGGMLVDAGLAEAANRVGVSTCPDLGAAASARALASMFAASAPAKDFQKVFARERHSDGPGLAALPGLIGLMPRAWDNRGFEIFQSTQDNHGNDAVAVGLTSVSGLLGAAVQWRPGLFPKEKKSTVTVVVLTNEVSAGLVPQRILSEIGSCLGLPIPAGFDAGASQSI